MAWHYVVKEKIHLCLLISFISIVVTCSGSATVFRGFPQVLSTCLLLFLFPEVQLVPKDLIDCLHCTNRASKALRGH